MDKKILILGKPNVGKSSLFNAIIGKQKAVVNDYEGLTRDINKQNFLIDEVSYQIIDSPGIMESNKTLDKEIKKIIISSIQKCDLLLLVVDAKENLTAEDFKVFQIARKSQKKIILIANKTEGKINNITFEECCNIGFGSPIKISTAHMQGIRYLKECIVQVLPNLNEEIKGENQRKLSIAIVGKTNSGKSTLINSLKGENISITGDSPNLTRDAVETFYENDFFTSKLIDTAGFSKTQSQEKILNQIFTDQTKKKIRLSKVILIVMDINDYFERLHSKIINLVYDDNRCIVLVVNKIDEQEGFSENSIITKIYELTPQIRGMPIFFISAKKKIGLDNLILGIKSQYENWNKRISTGKLNSWLQSVIRQTPPPLHKGRLIKLKYISQVSTSPPKFNIFLNFDDILKDQYKRFIENKLKINFDMNGLPLKIIYKKSNNPYE